FSTCVSTAASSCGKDRATRLSGIRPRQRSRKYLATARSTILRCDASAEILGSHCLLESKLRKEHAMPELKVVENATCTFCGCVERAGSVCRGPGGMAVHGVGEVTCWLGDVKTRAGLVILWGSNPAESHPRHWGRYSTMPKGQFVPNGRKDRTVVLVDVRKSKSAPAADIFLQVKPRKDFEALWALRALVKGVELDSSAADETGIPLDQLKDLAQRMKSCKFGILFFGMGLSMTRGKHLNVEAALSLARDLNEFTRFYAKPMRGHG